MKRPPFKIRPNVYGAYRRDGKWVVGGRLSFAWETLVMSVASGSDGVHEIKRDRGPWHVVSMTVEEAESELGSHGDIFGAAKVRRARAFRARREARA